MDGDGLIRALVAPLGVWLYWLLIQSVERQQAACRRKHGRSLFQQACYRLGYLGSRGYQAAKQGLRPR